MAYSDAERAEALIRLALNRYNYERTARETGLPAKTLRRWDKNVPKKGVSDLLERAIERLLMAIPENLSGQEWAISLGILMDKWLLVQGKATSRSEAITKRFGGLSDDEVGDILAEADRILAEAAGGGAAEGDPEPGV